MGTSETANRRSAAGIASGSPAGASGSARRRALRGPPSARTPRASPGSSRGRRASRRACRCPCRTRSWRRPPAWRPRRSRPARACAPAPRDRRGSAPPEIRDRGEHARAPRSSGAIARTRSPSRRGAAQSLDEDLEPILGVGDLLHVVAEVRAHHARVDDLERATERLADVACRLRRGRRGHAEERRIDRGPRDRDG